MTARYLLTQFCIFISSDAGLEIYIDSSTDLVNWFETAADNSLYDLQSVTISKKNNQLKVVYAEGMA